MTTKTCRRCDVSKPVEDFYRKSGSKDGRQSICKDCQRDYFKDWYAKNGESVRQRSREWAWRNPEVNRERARQWNVDNKDRHRLRAKKAKHSRRAVEKATSVGPIDLRQVWQSQAGVCPLCVLKIDWAVEFPDPMSKSVDHIIPIARGGGHVQENVQWAHLKCNLSKGARI